MPGGSGVYPGVPPGGTPAEGGSWGALSRPPEGGSPGPPRGGPPGGVHFRRVFNNSPSRDSWDTPIFGPPGGPPQDPPYTPPGYTPPGPPRYPPKVLYSFY